MNLLYLKDFYKVGHVDQYPPGTDLIFSNLTPRKSLLPGVEHAVFFGLKYFMSKYLPQIFDWTKIEIEAPHAWNEVRNFYNFEPEAYKRFMKKTLGSDSQFSHIFALKELESFPLAIYALDEGTVVPMGVPMMVMFNTNPEFYWLTNMIETILSCTLWGACTSATIAREYRIICEYYANKTADNPAAVDYQCHDFSMRGMFGLEAAIISGMAHCQYFKGTDCIPAVLGLGEYYDQEYWPASIPATEHSVMSAGRQDNEIDTITRLITHVYPTGMVSIVSDTWDLWHVVDHILPQLKELILSRQGTVVIRPDSGDPCEIVPMLIEKLWGIFGGHTNSKGYKQLDSHIGAIYGDSITLGRAKIILHKLMDMGFSSTNIVFGVGSYSYQYNTRDTFGFAVKSTYCQINGIGYPITKNPKTDNGTKKSHSGLLKVINGKNGLEVKQNCSWKEFYQEDNLLKLRYMDGRIIDE